jgi:antitoxin YefM
VRGARSTLTRTMKSALQRTIDLEDDIRPVSDFRADAAGLLARARQTQRALVLTQRGRTAAVVLDVAAYQRLIDELELLRDLQTATQQLAEGQGVPQAKARKLALERLKA